MGLCGHDCAENGREGSNGLHQRLRGVPPASCQRLHGLCQAEDSQRCCACCVGGPTVCLCGQSCLRIEIPGDINEVTKLSDSQSRILQRQCSYHYRANSLLSGTHSVSNLLEAQHNLSSLSWSIANAFPSRHYMPSSILPKIHIQASPTRTFSPGLKHWTKKSVCLPTPTTKHLQHTDAPTSPFPTLLEHTASKG